MEKEKERIPFNFKLKVLKTLYVSAIIVVSALYITISSGGVLAEYRNIVTNILNILVTIGISVYLTYNISKLGFAKASLEQQKLIARNSIDHTNGNVKHVIRLMDRVNGFKIDSCIDCDETYKQFLEEIIFSLQSISESIVSSQNDLKRLVKDELVEEQQKITDVISEISKGFKLVEKINADAKMISKLQSNEGKHKQEISELKDEIETLRNDLKEIERNTDNKISTLKYNSSSAYIDHSLNTLYSGTSINADWLNNGFTLSKSKNNIPLTIPATTYLSNKINYHIDENGKIIYDDEEDQ